MQTETKIDLSQHYTNREGYKITKMSDVLYEIIKRTPGCTLDELAYIMGDTEETTLLVMVELIQNNLVTQYKYAGLRYKVLDKDGKIK